MGGSADERQEELARLFRDPVTMDRFVSNEELVRFAEAVGAPPRYEPEPDGSGTRVVAHPMFYIVLRTACQMLVPKTELRHDGTPAREIPAWSRGVVAGESSVDFFSPLRGGESVRVGRRLAGVRATTGRSGRLYLVTCVFEVMTRDRGTAVRESFTRIIR